MTEIDPRPGFVGSRAAAARIAAMSAASPGSEKILAAMHEEDRQYANSLAEIRKAAQLTQTAVAQGMGLSQGDVSRIERRGDILLSTLATYLAQVGDDPRVVVRVAGRDVEMHLLAAS
jgi:DNA-binding XRE family transcriptional regulator